MVPKQVGTEIRRWPVSLKNNISWYEFPQDHVKRGLTNRKKRDQYWLESINSELVINAYSDSSLQFKNELYQKRALISKLSVYADEMQEPGEEADWSYPKSFADHRAFSYTSRISKPLDSHHTCSRLSPYLAWGNISSKQVYHYIIRHPNFKAKTFHFKSMISRLMWRSYFTQKFEVDCSYDYKCINKGYEKMVYTNSANKIKAWKTGNTGYPLVDACMRCLLKTGWINFRMRAMLVSFLCHHMDVDWRIAAEHLSKVFLDYFHGIHYPQIQMQAGTTGVNTIRIYNPVKQSYEQDENGEFIKKWIPELRRLPKVFIHEPWKMTEMEQMFYTIQIPGDYPMPIIDYKSAGRRARDKIWGFRNHNDVKADARRILKIHKRNS